MKRSFPKPFIAIGLGTLVAALAVVAAAVAFFSSAGTGSASLNIGSVKPPSNVATQQGGSNVTISWSAASLSAGGTVQGYRVTRSDNTTVCGSSTLVTGTSCTDTTVPSGSYTYTVTAVENTFTASAASSAIAILTAPTISSSPPNSSANASPSFSFTGGGGSSYQCQIDGGAFSSCSSPLTFSGLSDGSHTFAVRASNGSSTGPVASDTWTINTTAPTISSEPSGPSANTSASFSFTSSTYSSFKCQIDNGGFSVCASPQTYSSLSTGSHTFQVEATSADGAATQVATDTWTINTTAPTITSKPAPTTSSTSATFSFTDDSFPGFECQLDSSSVTACNAGSASYSGLTPGSHTFKVYAQGADGSTTGTTSYTWTITAASPSVVMDSNTGNQLANGGTFKSTTGTYLIAVYCSGVNSACGSTASEASVNTGSGTPFSGTSAVKAIADIGTGTNSSKDCLELIQVTGSGSSGTVTVNPGSGGTVAYIEVLQLPSGASITQVSGGNIIATNQGSSNSAATNTLSDTSKSEVALVGITDGSGGTTVTGTPSGFSQLGTYQVSTGLADMGVYFDPTAQATATFGLSAIEPWATIAVEIG